MNTSVFLRLTVVLRVQWDNTLQHILLLRGADFDVGFSHCLSPIGLDLCNHNLLNSSIIARLLL